MREYSDPGLAPLASQAAMRGQAGVVAPRGPIKPTAPDEGPIDMNPIPSQPSVYIPGASRHELIHCDPGADDQVINYAVGIGSWQSRSHSGEVSQPAPSAQGSTPPGPDMGPNAESYPKEQK